MPSSIFQNQNQNNPMNMISQFNSFRQSLNGKDPQAILNNLVSTGQVTQAQLDQATQMAQQFSSLFNVR